MCKLAQILKSFDFFAVSQFLRYNGQGSYKTLTGGLVSLLTVGICFMFFANTLMDIVCKRNVTLAAQVQHMAVPTPKNITFGPEGGFMFTISISGLNLSQTNLKYFDITASLNQFQPVAKLVKQMVVPLQMCTQSHFDFNQQIASYYDSLNASNFLCPQLNSTIQIQGSITSNVFKRLTVKIQKCNNTGNTVCASDLMVQELQNSLDYFGLGVGVINTELNPSLSKTYQSYYLNDRNYFPFTRNLAIKIRAQIEEYNIKTDQSIFLYHDVSTQKGLKVPDYFQYNVIPVLSDTYAVIHFQKSNVETTYQRSFPKIDSLLSYIGGLIGSIIGIIFVFNSYNELAFKLSLANELFKYDNEKEIGSEKFNFIEYIRYFFYKIKKCLCCKESEAIGKMRIYNQCQEEVNKQLNVRLLIKKLIFFERYVAKASKKLKINLPKLYSKSTLKQVEQFRHHHENPQRTNPQQQISPHKRSKESEKSTINQYYSSPIIRAAERSHLIMPIIGIDIEKNDCLLNKPEFQLQDSGSQKKNSHHSNNHQ